MLTPEITRQSMYEMLEEALGPNPRRSRDREALRVRNERRTAFLAKADELLAGEYGYDQIEERKDSVRLTRPIDATIGDQTVQVQVIRTTSSFQRWRPPTGNSSIKTIIQATQPETGIKRSLFSIVQDSYHYGSGAPHKRTRILNYHGGVATNEEVLKGLQAINFIGDQIASQTPLL